MNPEGPVTRLVEGPAPRDAHAQRLAELLRASIRPEPLSTARLHSVEQRMSVPTTPARIGIRPLRVPPVAIAAVALVVAATVTLVHARRQAHQSSSTAPIMNHSEVAPPLPAPVELRPPSLNAPAPAPPTPGGRARASAAPEPTRVAHHRLRGQGEPDDSLDAQVDVIRDGMALLRVKHDVDGAVRLLSDFDRRFPGGQLAPEAHALLEEALLAQGDAGR
jgi:TolA-binding protein